MESQQLYIEDLKEAKDEDMLQLVGFKLGDEEYAIDVLKIQEIIRLVEITSVPRTDNYIMGVMNLRGKVIPVVDLRVRFNLEKSDFDKKTRIIVVRFEKENIGFVVDEVTQVIRINKSMIEPTPPLVGSIGQEYILGICKYNDRLIILLDIDTLIYEDKGHESELKKKFRPSKGGSSSGGNTGDVEVQSPLKEEDEIQEEEESATIHESLQQDHVQDVQEELPKEEEKHEASGGIDDIDALIAMELAKREKETEELIKKKKSTPVQESIEDILNDAVKQAEEKINHDAVHVDQSDLDALIAMELAKREKETEEMIKRKKEQEKKNDIDNLSFESTADTEGNVETLQEGGSSKKENLEIEVDSIAEIKELARKIIHGESKEISIDVKGEIGEIVKLIMNTKEKLDNIEDSTEKVPTVAKNLEFINDTTEKATSNLLQHSDELSNIYNELSDGFRDIERYVESRDIKSALKRIEELEKTIEKAESLGFEILQALEFQDITEQKINKVIRNIEEIGARLGSILGFVVSSASDESSKVASQEEIDKLLSDFGLN
ncbi:MULTISPECIES: protein phosphatase CheZ [Calditerrivibrio]|uniref:protein phosphatase CheZ n=1 Tax=Calditerrivibrio TaxID=545865 RepID=UPI003C778F8A